jgi:2-hydroxyacyl-CoA lyase 1
MMGRGAREEFSVTSTTGASVLVRALKQQGVDHLFGVVGYPVTSIAHAAQQAGIAYIGMRNEQAASYAAQAASYFLGRPQACLVVSGPGVVHGLAGLANAQENNWPMLLIGGASSSRRGGMGAFQEGRQVHITTPFTKYSRAVECVERIPYYVEQAMRTAQYGRPGPVALEMPEDVIDGTAEETLVHRAATVGPPPRSLANPDDVAAALRVLRNAERPLVIVGKGMAAARAEREVREFIDRSGLPFLPTPMGKGVVPDNHPLSVAPARSAALQEADVVVLLGARLNWMLHFGLPPRFAPDVRVIQLDVWAEEMSHNVPTTVALLGDGCAVVAQLNEALDAAPWQYPSRTPWWTLLHSKMEDNAAAVTAMAGDDTEPMNYYRVLRDLREAVPADAIIVSEGANTMDIGRTQLPTYEPRTRVDAGTFGTMGVGLGFAIAAAVTHPGRPVVALEGDSAFGFSGMEMETICRHQLPITVVILNNGGISVGPEGPLAPGQPWPPTALNHGARYEKIAEAFGGAGYYVEHVADLRPALDKGLSAGAPTIVNVRIAANASRKQQEYSWRT